MRPCFLSIDDATTVDLASLLGGSLEISTSSVITALSYLRSSEVIISEEEFRALQSMSDERWEELGDVCIRAGVTENVIRGLTQKGLALLDESPSHIEHPVVPSGSLSTWNKYAVLYHFMNKWRDMHLKIELPREPDRLGEIMSIPEEVFKDFIEAYGLPPPAFKTLDEPALVRELPLVERSGDLFSVLQRRKTTRAFDPNRSVSLEDFSTLVYYSFGCHGYTRVYRDIIGLKKTSPSGGCLHPIEVYPLVMNVDGLLPGLYHYNVEHHRLDARKLLTVDDARELANVFTAGQSFPRWCSVLFVMTARFYRNHWKYRNHPRAYVVLYMDAAHLSQTLYLLSAELSLGGFFTAAVNGGNIEDELGLDGFTEGAIGIFGCGIPVAAENQVDPEFATFIPRETEVPDVE